MNAVGSLLLLVAVASVAAMGGFVASAVVLRKKRRARGYFVLGVVTGWAAAVISRRDLRTLGAFSARAAVRPFANIAGLLVNAAQFRG